MEIQNLLHQQVWERFIRMPYGHLSDYADESGNAPIPSASECEQSIPDALGWWTPIENGAFFTGLYLISMIQQYQLEPNDTLYAEIQKLVCGLFLLQDVSTTPGFIARGVADDGKSHYPISSEDQFVPWVLGLYTYYISPLCVNRDAVKERLLVALCAVRDAGWKIPTERFGVFSNDWLHATDWRGVCKMLFCANLIFVLSDDKKDFEHYASLRDGTPDGYYFTRLETVSHGFSYDMVENVGLIQFWIDIAAHLALQCLEQHDTSYASQYHAARLANGLATVRFVKRMQDFDNLAGDFDCNWRRINHLWQPFENDFSAAVQSALNIAKIWTNEVVPHRYMEHSVLGNALFATWIACTCGDEKLQNIAFTTFHEYVAKINWQQLHLSYAFVAESILIFEKMTQKQNILLFQEK